MDDYTHEPVLLGPCIESLAPRPGGLYVDGTTGLGGHSEAIAATGAGLVCLDKDEEALAAAKQRLAPFGSRIRFVHGDFRRLEDILDSLGLGQVDGVLLDLGVSSLQLDKPERGFSHRFDAALDMRMDRQSTLSAHEIVNEWDAERLTKILRDYGEERYARPIAAAIVRARPVEGTAALREIVLGALPAKARRDSRHPARRVFQALRIAVNDELGAVTEGVEAAIRRLAPGGRLCVIGFHSLEDRIVKHAIREHARGCECPPSFPACVCQKRPLLRALARIGPDDEELSRNPRSASAILRVAEKI